MDITQMTKEIMSYFRAGSWSPSEEIVIQGIINKHIQKEVERATREIGILTVANDIVQEALGKLKTDIEDGRYRDWQPRRKTPICTPRN
jgi:hypothetical protein